MSTPVAAVGTSQDFVRVRVWDLVVRSTHWLIALSIAVLSVTGIDIGHPFLLSPASSTDRFTTGIVRVVHFYAAIVFTLAVLSRLLWMFIGKGHATWREFIPVAPERRAGFGSTLKFYLFLRRTPAPSVGHNPLAASAYVFVFGLYLVMILTGTALYAVDAVHSPIAFAKMFLPLFGGITGARWIHHVVMWLLIGFFVHHLYSAILTSVVERNGTMESIFTGSKWVPRKLAEADRKAQEAAK
jgi:Ni/Fe-hydrogenase 1 B-type cytochrome subunit